MYKLFILSLYIHYTLIYSPIYTLYTSIYTHIHPIYTQGLTVSLKITNEANPTITYGRQFDHTTALYSKISRQSIDALKEFFKE